MVALRRTCWLCFGTLACFCACLAQTIKVVLGTEQNLAYWLPALLVLGVMCQWIAWRTRLPSVPVFLAVGLLIGPGLGVFHPSRVFDQLTLPFVSLAAAVVLFEGGLSVSSGDGQNVSCVVRRLVTIGLLVTWLLIALAARLTLGFGMEASLLLGAVLVVTGPTVIGPLLRDLPLRDGIAKTLRLEGILNDPIGALLAIVVFYGIQARHLEMAFGHALFHFTTSLILGVVAGFLVAQLVVLLFDFEVVPPSLQQAFLLAAVLGTYALCQALRHESGLLAVTVMGLALSRQKRVDTRPSLRFYEHARTIIIPFLFLILTSRIPQSAFAAASVSWVGFTALLLFVIRPAVVLLSTLGINLPLRERLYLSAMAPRGIVAAAVASIFGLRMAAGGYQEAQHFVPVVFTVILASGFSAGLLARPLLSGLNLQERKPPLGNSEPLSPQASVG